MKKIILSFGALIVTSTPLILVISCGKNKTPKKSKHVPWVPLSKSTLTLQKKIEKLQEITEIPEGYFRDQILPNNFSIPKNITRIGNFAFERATLKTTITYNPNMDYGSAAFQNANIDDFVIADNTTLSFNSDHKNHGKAFNLVHAKTFTFGENVVVNNSNLDNIRLPYNFKLPNSVIWNATTPQGYTHILSDDALNDVVNSGPGMYVPHKCIHFYELYNLIDKHDNNHEIRFRQNMLTNLDLIKGFYIPINATQILRGTYGIINSDELSIFRQDGAEIPMHTNEYIKIISGAPYINFEAGDVMHKHGWHKQLNIKIIGRNYTFKSEDDINNFQYRIMPSMNINNHYFSTNIKFNNEVWKTEDAAKKYINSVKSILINYWRNPENFVNEDWEEVKSLSNIILPHWGNDIDITDAIT